MRLIKKGSTDQSVVIRIVDSGDGTPETGVVFNSAGIDLWYRREGATKTSITEATLATLDAAHSDGGILHIGDGYYRLDLPDAAFATGANGVMVGGTVTGMVVIGCYVPLVDFDPQDAVRAGLTALPNAAADAAGGLIVSDAGGLDADAQRSDVAAILVDTGTTIDDLVDDLEARIGVPANLGSGATVAANLADIEAQTDDIGAAGAGLTAIPDSAGVTTLLGRIPAALFAGITSLAQWLGLLAGKQAGNATARTEVRATGAGAGTFDETTDSVEAIRDRGDAAWLTATGFSTLTEAGVRSAVGLASANLDTQLAAIDDFLDTEVAAIKAKTDLIPADPADASDIAALIDALPTAAETATAVLTTTMTESYSTASGTKTLAQALYEIFALVGDFSVSGTTLTVRKLDGTAAATFTLDSGSAPTSVTRAT